MLSGNWQRFGETCFYFLMAFTQTNEKEKGKCRKNSEQTTFNSKNRHTLSVIKVPMQCPLVLLVNVGWREGKAVGSGGGWAMRSGENLCDVIKQISHPRKQKQVTVKNISIWPLPAFHAALKVNPCSGGHQLSFVSILSPQPTLIRRTFRYL